MLSSPGALDLHTPLSKSLHICGQHMCLSLYVASILPLSQSQIMPSLITSLKISLPISCFFPPVPLSSKFRSGKFHIQSANFKVALCFMSVHNPSPASEDQETKAMQVPDCVENSNGLLKHYCSARGPRMATIRGHKNKKQKHGKDHLVACDILLLGHLSALTPCPLIPLIAKHLMVLHAIFNIAWCHLELYGFHIFLHVNLHQHHFQFPSVLKEIPFGTST